MQAVIAAFLSQNPDQPAVTVQFLSSNRSDESAS